jgi:Tol biopolymer transport system component
VTQSDPQQAAELESRLIANVRQLTFEGRRAGEGYFSADGKRMVFQSEREVGNPFFQIYLMDLETGDQKRVSPGYGKTTCAWIHPDGNRVLFASTQEDKDARQKQKDELAQRQSGTARRYAWDYDEHYDVFIWDERSGEYTNVTNSVGYDAEASWSPDGRRIAFTSNRSAYGDSVDDDTKKRFELDPAYMNDIYIMDTDGTNVRRLTTAPGYDGGPFFSPDGKRICWRRFSPDGVTAEIMTMTVDGTDQRQLTRMNAMSWAPFYHPSGEYLIFTTNRHGFSNFELYLIDSGATREPLRVTYTDGFDGLPVFTPCGQRLSWTSNRSSSERSQIYIADWDHRRARQLMGLDGLTAATETTVETALAAAADASQQTSTQFAPQDILRHVDYLCRPELEGRMTGTRGEQLATAYVAAYMDSLGLDPGGDDGGWFDPFEFTSGVELGPDNSLLWGEKRYGVSKDWTPISFSKTGPVDAAPVVFAGYGIAAPEEDGQAEYDSFVHLDVADKWLLVFRFMPEGITPERRQHLARFASLRYKAMLARDRGARGLILVSGPNSQVREQLIPLRFDGTLAGTSVPVISIRDELAASWLESNHKNLKTLQDKLDGGEPVMGFELEEVRLTASVDLRQEQRSGRNVLGYLRAAEAPTEQIVVVGAHVDHLGKGRNSSSLAADDEKGEIHFGADDNASGVAAMLEMAQYLSDQKANGNLALRRDVLFAAWSGEELGLIGASHFVKSYRPHHDQSPTPHETPSAEDPATPALGHGGHGASSAEDSLYPAIAACLNLDMVGRLDKKLILQGVGSSSIWPGEIERRNVPVGLPITPQDDSYLPTDASAFFLRGVPILSAFTGSHSEYHTPRDTPEKLNYEGTANIARFMALVARSVAMRESPPDYVAQTAPQKGSSRATMRAYLGTIPDYAESDVSGVKLSGVAANGPAAKAGVKAADIVVELAGRKIENIYDYTYAIEALKIGQEVKIVVQREGRRIELAVTPASRQ